MLRPFAGFPILMSTPQQTLRDAVQISGIGLHSGREVTVKLLPQEEAGLVFARTDLSGAPEISASWRYIIQTHHATTLAFGDVSVSTPEHLMAALWCVGISNCRIELNAPEVPILDGSAAPWCAAIQAAGLRTLDSARPEYSLKEAILIESREGAVIGLPHQSLRATVDVDYGVSYLDTQVYASEISATIFAEEIAPARTFTLETWLEPLRAQGLIQGGSVENAIVLGAEVPSSPLRFSDELARHKTLDLLGDIALLFGEDGGVLRAHLIAVRAGHELHRQWMEKVLRCESLRQIA
jgi:UDP-3-O-[3-hydroxymyristoyl] N-acetylglucosamine deacetylase